MKIHELKVKCEDYKRVYWDKKKAEIRKNDKDYQIGDVLCLREIDIEQETGKYILAEITDILTHEEFEGIADGYVMLSFKVIDKI